MHPYVKSWDGLKVREYPNRWQWVDISYLGAFDVAKPIVGKL